MIRVSEKIITLHRTSTPSDGDYSKLYKYNFNYPVLRNDSFEDIDIDVTFIVFSILRMWEVPTRGENSYFRDSKGEILKATKVHGIVHQNNIKNQSILDLFQ